MPEQSREDLYATKADYSDPMAALRQRAATNAHSSQPEPGADYQDFTDMAGGYGYRLYADDSIKIIYAPEGAKAGIKLTPNMGGKMQEAYTAIKQEIDAKVGDPRENLSDAAGSGEGPLPVDPENPGEYPESSNMADLSVSEPGMSESELKAQAQEQELEMDDRLGESDVSVDDLKALANKLGGKFRAGGV